MAAAYSPRLRPGVPVSFPVPWADLGQVAPADFTIRTAPGLMDGKDPWAKLLPKPQALPADLIEHGHTIPVARVQAMLTATPQDATRNEPANGVDRR